MGTTRTSTRKAQKPAPKKAVKARPRPAKKPAAAKLADALHAVVPTEVPRKKAGLSIKLFSRLTGFSERAIASWEAGEPVSEHKAAYSCSIAAQSLLPAWRRTACADCTAASSR